MVREIEPTSLGTQDRPFALELHYICDIKCTPFVPNNSSPFDPTRVLRNVIKKCVGKVGGTWILLLYISFIIKYECEWVSGM